MNGNDRSIVGLVMLAHAMVHTYEMSIPILVAIWLDTFPVTASTIGLIVSAGYALFGLGALPGGVLADVFGSRRLIVACLLGMAGSFIALSVASTIPLIALALLLWGVAASVYHPSGLALISKGVNARGSAFAYHGIAGNVGIAFGPLATTLLLLVLDWSVVVGILAVPAGIAGAFALTVDIDETAAVEVTDGDGEAVRADGDEETTDSRSDGVSSVSEFLADSRRLFAGSFLAVFGVVMLSGLYYRGTLTFLPEYLSGLPLFAAQEVAGRSIEPGRYLYVGLLMIGMAGQYVGGRLTDRMDVERGIAAAFAVLALVAVTFIPAANAGLVPLLAVSAVLGFALFVVQPLYQATVAEYTPPGTRGLSYGYTYLGVFGVGALGATVAGTLLERFSPSALFLVLAGFAAAASLLGGALALRRSR